MPANLWQRYLHAPPICGNTVSALILVVTLATGDWLAQHLRDYLDSGGAQGHIVDLREIGGHQFTTTLLLQTVGRESGQTRIVPLIYGDIGGEIVIVASKGGADVHPAWYLNIKDSDDLSFQVATQAFRGSWREPEGSERADGPGAYHARPLVRLGVAHGVERDGMRIPSRTQHLSWNRAGMFAIPYDLHATPLTRIEAQEIE